MPESGNVDVIVRAVARLARVLEQSGTGLSLASYRILSVVAGGDQRATQLAVRLALAKPTVTAAVDALVERGYLERRDVEGDRRAFGLHITAAGRRALRSAEQAMAQRLEPILERVEDLDRVIAAMEDLQRALDATIRDSFGNKVASRG